MKTFKKENTLFNPTAILMIKLDEYEEITIA